MAKRNRRKGRRRKHTTSVQLSARPREQGSSEPPAATDTDVMLKTALTIDSPSNFYTGLTDDIGEGGLFVATDTLYPVGTALALEFSLPDDRGPIRVAGEVRWIRKLSEWDEHKSGVGVAFKALPDDARARIEAFLAHRDALFYD